MWRERTQKDLGCKCYKHVQFCVCVYTYICMCVYIYTVYCAARVKPAKKCVCLYEMFEKR